MYATCMYVCVCMNYLNGDGDEQAESFVKSRWDDPSEEKLGVCTNYPV